MKQVIIGVGVVRRGKLMISRFIWRHASLVGGKAVMTTETAEGLL